MSNETSSQSALWLWESCHLASSRPQPCRMSLMPRKFQSHRKSYLALEKGNFHGCRLSPLCSFDSENDHEDLRDNFSGINPIKWCAVMWNSNNTVLICTFLIANNVCSPLHSSEWKAAFLYASFSITGCRIRETVQNRCLLFWAVTRWVAHSWNVLYQPHVPVWCVYKSGPNRKVFYAAASAEGAYPKLWK